MLHPSYQSSCQVRRFASVEPINKNGKRLAYQDPQVAQPLYVSSVQCPRRWMLLQTALAHSFTSSCPSIQLSLVCQASASDLISAARRGTVLGRSSEVQSGFFTDGGFLKAVFRQLIMHLLFANR